MTTYEKYKKYSQPVLLGIVGLAIIIRYFFDIHVSDILSIVLLIHLSILAALDRSKYRFLIIVITILLVAFYIYELVI